jgi:hypothetical protein
MSASAGWVIAAGSIAAVNEAVFVPAVAGKGPDFGSVWRIVPATALLAVGMALLERAVPPFAVGLSKLLVFAVLVFPVGNAPAPVEEAAKLVTASGKAA